MYIVESINRADTVTVTPIQYHISAVALNRELVASSHKVTRSRGRSQ